MKSKKSKSSSLSKANKISPEIYARIRKIVENARGNIMRAVNTEMVIAYWRIGREIVENEGGKVVVVPYVKGVSTTTIIDRIVKSLD